MEDNADINLLVDAPFKSPFSLNLNVDKARRRDSDENIRKQISLSSSFDAHDEALELSDSSSLINPSPFSLNLKKVTALDLGNSGGSANMNSAVSYMSSIQNTNLTSEEKVVELQKEVAVLKKELDAKEQKLISSVRSIKQFWSPELKKERSARKEEVEKLTTVKEKCDSASTELESCKGEIVSQTEYINELQEQLSATEWKVSNNDQLANLRTERQLQNDEIIRLGHMKDETDAKYRLLEEQSREKSSIITELEKILDEQENREKESKQTIQALDEEVQRTSAEARQTIMEHEKRNEIFEKTCSDLQSAMKEKDDSVCELNTQFERLKQNAEELRRIIHEADRKNTESEKEIDSLNDKLSMSDQELSEKTHTLTCMSEDLVQLRKADVEHIERIEELEDLFLTKDKDFDALQEQLKLCESELEANVQLLREKEIEMQRVNISELEHLREMIQVKEQDMSIVQKKSLQMRGRLDELEKQSREREEKLNLMNDEQRSQINDLESTIDLKEDEIERVRTELGIRVDELLMQQEQAQVLTRKSSELEHEMASIRKTLDTRQKELSDVQLREKASVKKIEELSAKCASHDTRTSEQETAILALKSDLTQVRSEYTSLSSELLELDENLKEKESLIETLEKEKDDQKEAEKAELEEMKQKYEENTKKEQEKNGKLSREIKFLKKTLDDKDKLLLLKGDVRNSSKELEKIKTENQGLHQKITNLEKDIEGSKREIHQLQQQKTEQEKPVISGPSKDAKTSKHLWDELTRKEQRIEELEKQVKEKCKQITTMRKAQNTERGKEHLNLSEKQKVEEKLEVEIQELKKDLEQKNQRIGMLEDALRESVSIAAEREDLLAQHVEMSEDAAKKIIFFEGEYDRVSIEKAITNIKNAFLILSLSEQDALVSCMRASKKRYIQELLNTKQESLRGAITEKDTAIATLEMKSSSKSNRNEIKNMKTDKEKLVAKLKDQTNLLMNLLNNEESKDFGIFHELQDSAAEQITEAIGQLKASASKLEFYIEELLVYLKDKNVAMSSSLPQLPRKHSKSLEQLDGSSKEELLSELRIVNSDGSQLKSYVDQLLDKLEG